MSENSMGCGQRAGESGANVALFVGLVAPGGSPGGRLQQDLASLWAEGPTHHRRGAPARRRPARPPPHDRPPHRLEAPRPPHRASPRSCLSARRWTWTEGAEGRRRARFAPSRVSLREARSEACDSDGPFSPPFTATPCWRPCAHCARRGAPTEKTAPTAPPSRWTRRSKPTSSAHRPARLAGGLRVTDSRATPGARAARPRPVGRCGPPPPRAERPARAWRGAAPSPCPRSHLG
jgi:hypothetical protein